MSGDGAKRDADGYLWITGRIDDMLNCSGHLMSTAQVCQNEIQANCIPFIGQIVLFVSLNIIVYQVESVLVEHKDVAEAAVVPIPHTVKGEALYCFVTMNDGTTFSASTQTELIALIRAKIAPFAMPDYIQVRLFFFKIFLMIFSFAECAGPPKNSVRKDHEEGSEEDC